MSQVYWSAYDPLETGSTNEDPLGFYTYAIRLAEEWLPGITTRTRRIRYYSMVCGGLLLIEEDLPDLVQSAEHHDAERVRLFLRWERLWAIWNITLPEEHLTGLIGRTKTKRFFKDGAFTSSSLDYPFIQRQADLGALGAYRSSLQAFGLLRSDTNELTLGGKQLGKLYWSHNGVRRVRGQCAEAVRTGRISSSRSAGRLALLGEKLGVYVPLARQACGASAGEELSILARCLLCTSGRGARRKRVLDYVRRHGLGQADETRILETAARRAGRADGGSELERCAATIVALERYRSVLMSIVNQFCRHLWRSGGAQPVAWLSRSPDLKILTREAQKVREGLLRFAESAEFADAFADFPLGRKLDMADGVSLLKQLLKVHEEEMARRRSPRWFFRAGNDAWDLNRDSAVVAEEDGRPDPYSYRTPNLLTMASELGRRI